MSTDTSRLSETEITAESGIVATLKKLRHSPTALAGGAITALLVSMAVFSTIDLVLFDKKLITALLENPQEMNPSAIYAPPSLKHPMGTDLYGRDILSRVIYGSRVALSIGIISVGIGFTGGVVIGALAAYEGGYVDDLLMRIMETLYAIPGLVLAMTFMAILGPSIYNLFLAYGIIGIPAYARVMRSEVLSIREEEYVDAARAAGLSKRKILFREIVPNGLAAVLVQATLSMGGVIIGAAALSFLGFGVQPPTASWGRMLNSAQQALYIAPWAAVFPGLMIFLTVMGFNMLGDGLRDAMDPQVSLKQRDLDPDDLPMPEEQGALVETAPEIDASGDVAGNPDAPGHNPTAEGGERE